MLKASVHPSVAEGSTKYKKASTAKQHREHPRPQSVAGMRKHIAEHPKDAMTAKRLAKVP